MPDKLDPSLPEATSIDGVNIHLGYIRRGVADMNIKIDLILSTSVKMEDFAEFKRYVEAKFATKEEVAPLKKTFYYVGSIIIASLMAAILALVWKH